MPHSGVRLRPAEPGDAAGIGHVFDAAVRDGWRYLGDLVRQPLFPASEWDQLIADHGPPDVLLVAVDDLAHVVGFTAAHPGDGEMFLLFVDPQHAGQGIGRNLLDAAHAALRAAGNTQAHLYTHEQNERALAVYTAAGYRPDGTVRESDFRGITLREPRLVKQLTPQPQ
jgi:ribosomal protein S18 acetylase RimI-like enzyme